MPLEPPLKRPRLLSCSTICHSPYAPQSLLRACSNSPYARLQLALICHRYAVCCLETAILQAQPFGCPLGTGLGTASHKPWMVR
eukprot:5623445-Amphidinium_carterae.1